MFNQLQHSAVSACTPIIYKPRISDKSSSALSVLFGMLGTKTYGLSLGNATLVIVFFSLFSTCAPAYLSILGPKTGMRQMIQARFSFG